MTRRTSWSVDDRFAADPVSGRLLSLASGRRFTSFTARRSAEDLAHLAERIDAGEVVPVIDRTHLMAEVPDAVRYLEAGHVAGKLVATA